MATIQPGEVQWYLSNPNAVTGFSGVGTPGNSRGNYMSTTVVNTSTTINNLFLDATGVMNAASEVDYQCLFVANNTVTGFSMKNPKVWLPQQYYVNHTSTTMVGSDPIGVVLQTSATSQAATISSQVQAPGVTNWVFPSATMSQGVAVPDIPPGYCIAIWFKRSLTNSGPTPVNTPDGVVVTVSFQSNA
jgi:hypothetical protein